MTTGVQQTDLPVSFNYINWVLASNRCIMAHLYKLTSNSGIVNYFTDFDTDITWNNQVWSAQGLRFEGLQRKLSIGVSVDEQEVKIWAKPTDQLFGSLFLSNAMVGLLDGAQIVRYRAVWKFVTGNVAADIQNEPLGCWTLFTGYMGEIVKGGPSHIQFKVRSALTKLNVNMPRNYYQPGCNWTLFDGGCTLNKSSFGFVGTVQTANNLVINPVGGVVPTIGADNIPYFGLGSLLFTSGVNSGLSVVIGNNDAVSLTLSAPLINAPQAGDTFIMYPGCSKAFETCRAKFGNGNNFRGFDKVPPVMVSA